MRWQSLALAAVGILILAGTLHAQITATISGAVQDESGAVLPGVTVTLTNVDTGVSRSVVTGDTGRYSAPQLPIGNYRVQAELTGFQTAVHTGLLLTVGREALVNLVLKVGDITEQVVVTGEAPLVDTTGSSVAALVDRRSIDMIPLNGRDITQLATLQQGVTLLTTRSTSPTAGQGKHISIAGGRPNQSAFLMDGTDLTGNSGKGVGGVSGAFLGVDTVQEFTVQMSNYSAEHGRAGGGIVNVVTRSGTNTMTGGVFYYHRNSALDARNFFDVEEPDFHRHQFGSTLGGPIRRDRTFFFGSYEGFRQDLGQTSITFVPTADAKAGILPNGRTVAMDPAIQPLLPLWPLPNGQIFADGTGEFFTAESETTRDDHASIKVDHRFSDKTSVFGRYTITDGEKVLPFFGSGFGGYPLSMTSRNQYATLQATRVVSNQIVGVLRLSGNRSGYAGLADPDVPELRFYPGRPVGNVGVSGVAGLGNGTNQPFDHPVTILDLAGDLTYSGTVHSIKTGFGLKKYLWGFQRDFRVNGSLGYLSWEDFLLNRGDSFQGILPGSPDTRRHYRQSTIGFFVQDDIRLNDDLTVNLGLRYEFITNPSEATGPRIAMIPRDWDVTQPVNGVLVDHVFENNPSLKNFSPRLGFAWSPTDDDRTSVRGGWGLFYDQIYPLLYDNMRIPPLFLTIDLRAQALPPGSIRYPDPVSAGVALEVLSPIGVDFFNENTTSIQQFNLTVQREILPQTVVQVGYLGSRAKHLPVGNDPNTRVPTFLPDGRVFFAANAPARNPNWGRLSILEWTGRAFYNAVATSINKRFSDGFQLNANYTFSRNVDDGSATIGGDAAQDNRARPNPYDILSNRGLAAHHVEHAFSLSSMVELPFGPGRRYGGSLTGFGGKLVEGWGIQGILTLRSGSPFSVTMGGDRARSFTGDQRPDLVPGASNNPVLGGIEQYYDVTAFGRPEAGFFGDLGRNTLVGPGLSTVDLSIVKNNQVGASTLQFRVEFFNLLNRANFSLPGAQVFTGAGAVPASAGRITSTVTTARQMQVAMRMTF
jgi:outer membrane receptor protein involved in Fe transport